MIYGYIRFTINTQNPEHSLEKQNILLKNYGCKKIAAEPFDCYKSSRPVFESLILNVLRNGDTLVVTRIDRFARNISECVSTMRYIFNKGARIHILDIGTLEDNETGELFLTALESAKILEQNRTMEYTVSQSITKRTVNSNVGRPRISKKRIAFALELLKTKTYHEVCELTGISRSALANEMKKRKVRKRFWE